MILLDLDANFLDNYRSEKKSPDNICCIRYLKKRLYVFISYATCMLSGSVYGDFFI